MTQAFDIYLASASPRRRQLLQQIGVRYRLIRLDIPEELQAGEAPEEYVTRLALAKARSGRQTVEDKTHPVMGADTAVVIDKHILGKPEGREEGLHMLAQLAGRTHQVMTAVALVGEKEYTAINISNVTFRSMTEDECMAYWESGECADKAGAYAVQGSAALFIENLQGSYSGVMGLPLFETGELLQKFGISMLENKVSS